MKRIILILFTLALPVLAQIQAERMVVDVEIRAHTRGHKVWMYEIDGKKIKVGSEKFAELSKLESVHWDKAIEQVYVKKNGKVKVKMKKGLTVLDYDNIDKKTMKDLLKRGHLIQ